MSKEKVYAILPKLGQWMIKEWGFIPDRYIVVDKLPNAKEKDG